MYVPEPKQFWFEDDLYVQIVNGSAHSVSGESPETSIIERLHATVEKITGKPVVVAKAKMGFY